MTTRTENVGTLQNPKRRYNQLDSWRGYAVPALAIAGSSDTGTWDDSPCPTPAVLAELRKLRKALKAEGITTSLRSGSFSNLFCGKRWVVVDKCDFERAATFANVWIEVNRFNTSYIHGANLDVYFN